MNIIHIIYTYNYYFKIDYTEFQSESLFLFIQLMTKEKHFRGQTLTSFIQFKLKLLLFLSFIKL